MTERKRVLLTILMGSLLLEQRATAAPADNLALSGISRVSETRVTRYVFRYEYRAAAKNWNSGPCSGASAVVSSVSPATRVTDAAITFGTIASGAVAQSADTFTIEHDRRQPFDPSSLAFAFAASESECQDHGIGRRVEFESSPLPDLSDPSLPGRRPDGTLTVFEIPGGAVAVDPNAPRGPLTVRGECLRWISLCLAAPERGRDDCARSAPVCSNQEAPWMDGGTCCPAQCFDDYRAAREAGSAGATAFQQAYREGSCFPGVPESE